MRPGFGDGLEDVEAAEEEADIDVEEDDGEDGKAAEEVDGVEAGSGGGLGGDRAAPVGG